MVTPWGKNDRKKECHWCLNHWKFIFFHSLSILINCISFVSNTMKRPARFLAHYWCVLFFSIHWVKNHNLRTSHRRNNLVAILFFKERDRTWPWHSLIEGNNLFCWAAQVGALLLIAPSADGWSSFLFIKHIFHALDHFVSHSTETRSLQSKDNKRAITLWIGLRVCTLLARYFPQ